MKELGGRKYLYLLLITSLSFTLVLSHLATSKEWFDFILGISLLFFGANVAEKFVRS